MQNSDHSPGMALKRATRMKVLFGEGGMRGRRWSKCVNMFVPFPTLAELGLVREIHMIYGPEAHETCLQYARRVETATVAKKIERVHFK